jgi:P-type conjugative transfer protein TrbJ
MQNPYSKTDRNLQRERIEIMKKSLLAILAASIFTSAAAPTAYAGDASFAEQLVQQATLLSQYSTQADQLQQQISMLQNAYANSAGLPIQAWPSAQDYLNSLNGLIKNTQGLTYEADNLSGQIQQQFGNGKTILPGYSQQLSTWNQNMMGQVGSVMQQYNLHANNAIGVQAAIGSLINASQTAQGRMQALQAGNQIAGIAVNEIQNLQSIVMSGNQAQLNYIANQTSKDQQAALKQQEFLRKAEGKY